MSRNFEQTILDGEKNIAKVPRWGNTMYVLIRINNPIYSNSILGRLKKKIVQVDWVFGAL